MPLDRDATLKHAEKLLRQGKLDGAIAEYVRLVHDQPRDWSSVNALGDLYVRAGDRDRAVEQFTRVADHMFAEGFLPKAAALYKKALRVRADHDHTLTRLAEIAAGQGLLGDARQYLKQLGRLRRDRGDERGAADALVRLALLDEADVDTRLEGARAAQTLGQQETAVALFRAAAVALSDAGRHRDAVDAITAAAALDPAAAGLDDVVTGVAVLPADPVQGALAGPDGAEAERLFAAGLVELTEGREVEARMAFTRLMTVAPGRRGELQELATELAAAGSMAEAFICTEVLVDDAVLVEEWDRALAALETLLRHGPHIPALVKLVELAVDGRRDDVMETAQERLADAYVEAGRADEARIIAEDLVARHPRADRHVQRLRRALAVLGVDDADAIAIVNRYREEDETMGEAVDLDGGGVPAEAEVEDAIVLDAIEIDLSGTLADLGSTPVDPGPAPARDVPGPPADLDAVFDDMRRRVVQAAPGGDGSAEYERGLQQVEQGRFSEAAASLRAAARLPRYRFLASARLGRLCVTGGDIAAGIEWFERAAEAPPPSADEGWSVLYDLAAALERIGESARALAVLLELEADARDYRDVRRRIEVLSRVQAGQR